MKTSTLHASLSILVSAFILLSSFSFGKEKGEGIPSELKGFRGMMIGELVKKNESSIVFKVEKIKKTWKGNKAERPQKAIGKTLHLNLSEIGNHHKSRIMKNFKGLQNGDRIEVEAFDLEKDTLCIKEWLKKVESEKE